MRRELVVGTDQLPVTRGMKGMAPHEPRAGEYALTHVECVRVWNIHGELKHRPIVAVEHQPGLGALARDGKDGPVHHTRDRALDDLAPPVLALGSVVSSESA